MPHHGLPLTGLGVSAAATFAPPVDVPVVGVVEMVERKLFADLFDREEALEEDLDMVLKKGSVRRRYRSPMKSKNWSRLGSVAEDFLISITLSFQCSR